MSNIYFNTNISYIFSFLMTIPTGQIHRSNQSDRGQSRTVTVEDRCPEVPPNNSRMVCTRFAPWPVGLHDVPKTAERCSEHLRASGAFPRCVLPFDEPSIQLKLVIFLISGDSVKFKALPTLLPQSIHFRGRKVTEATVWSKLALGSGH